MKQQRRRGMNAKAAGYPVGQPERKRSGSAEREAISRGISTICLKEHRARRVDMYVFIGLASWMGKRPRAIINTFKSFRPIQGPAAFGVNFHSLWIEVWSMVNSQIPLLTGQPSVDVELLQNNA